MSKLDTSNPSAASRQLPFQGRQGPAGQVRERGAKALRGEMRKERGMDDAYQSLLEAMGGGTGPAGLVMGKVTSVAPLKILVGGNTMERDELLCNPALLGRGKQVSGKLSGSGSVGNASGEVSITVEGTLRRTVADWTAGEQLLMLPIEDAQRYIIICKVVEL